MTQTSNWMNFKTERHGSVYQRYEKLYDVIDALAAIAFIIGSALFFSEATQMPATWLFLIGSTFFAVRPLVHLLRDFHLARLPAPDKAGGENAE